MPAFDLGGKSYNNTVQLALEHVGGKWKLPLLWRLRSGAQRFSELRRSLNEHLTQGKITDHALSAQLRELTAAGLITRKVYPVVPPHTEYALTELGHAALPCIPVLRRFGEQLREELERAS